MTAPERIVRQAKRLVRNSAKDFGLGWRVPRAYLRAATAPVDPRKILFVESSLPELPDAFKVLYARVDADETFDARFISLGKHRVSSARYLRNCEELAREVATARVVYLCDASDVISSLPLRPETRVVQLWHACGAFKRFGMSTAESGYGLSRADIERHPFYGNLSLVTVSSAEVEWAYVEAMCLDGREHVVQPLGVSRTDLLFSSAFHEQAFRNLYARVPEAIGKRVLLWAPTLRGSLANPTAPPHPDFEACRRALGEGWVVLVKQHPMVRERPLVPGSCAGFTFDVTDSLAIDELLVAADMLATDYSSVVFEYSLTGRPMAFFAPDLADYIDERDFYYDYATMTPGPVASTSAEFAVRLAELAGPSAGEAKALEAERAVEAFRDKFMGACDGHATERIHAAALAAPPASTPEARVRAAKAGIWRRRPHVAFAQMGLNACYRSFSRAAEERRGVAFVSRQADEPSYDFAELARRLEERGVETTMLVQKARMRDLLRYVRHVLAELRLLARSEAVVLDRYDPVVSLLDFDCEPPREPASAACAPDAPVNVEFPQRPVVLQMWHAFGAFKKFGFQYVDTLEGHSAGFTADWRIHRNYSWIACSGEGARAGFASAFSCSPERVVALARPEYDELVEVGKRPSRRCSGRPRVLMAPTLRTNPLAAHPFRDLYAVRDVFASGLDADVEWAFHPLESGLPAPGNVSDELLACDVVVTDYSSLVYEAHLLGKPVVFYVPDIESFRLAPGLNRDPLELSREICATTPEALQALLRGMLDDPGSYPRHALDRFIGDAFTDPADPAEFLIEKISRP